MQRQTGKFVDFRLALFAAMMIGWGQSAKGAPAADQEPPAEPVPQATPAGAATAAGTERPSAKTATELTPKTSLPRETPVENALDRSPISGSAFGGYGEITLNSPTNASSVLDARRLVLYFGHDFNERIRFYSELELEHAVTSSSDKGEVEIEQAYLDALLNKRLNLRGGVILMPAGIVNIYHEPPSFNGVDRPDVDQFVIPSTWREPGIGIFGEIAEGLRYQLYLVNGFNANRFTAESAIREGHQEAQLAYAGDYGGIARLDYEPVLGTVIGVSAYGATSGNSLASRVGKVPVWLFEMDARFHRGGFTARGELALLFIGQTAALNEALQSAAAEQQDAGPVSSQARGAYAEVGYDVLRLLAPRSDQSVTAFTRFDYADTQVSVPAGLTPRLEFRRFSQMLGLVYRPIPQVALKADWRHHWLGNGDSYNEFASAITWLF